MEVISESLMSPINEHKAKDETRKEEVGGRVGLKEVAPAALPREPWHIQGT